MDRGVMYLFYRYYYLFIFLNLIIQTFIYCFYMLVNWFILVHMCLMYDTVYVLPNHK